MTLQIKERIVGVVVIICLLLIWGPFFLSKKPPEEVALKDNKIPANQAPTTIAINDSNNIPSTQLVDNTLPPQTAEEQLQAKQPPVLPMPAAQTQVADAEDDDITVEEPTLQWSGPKPQKAEAKSATVKVNEVAAKTVPPEEEQIPIQPAPAQSNNINHTKDSTEDLNDESLVKTSEANEAKLKKLFEKNEQASISAKVVAATVTKASTKAKTQLATAPIVKANKNKETKAAATTSNKWIVEVATLSNPRYVTVLKQKLAKNGFVAFSRVGHSSNGNPIYYIWIGAENNREQAESLAKRLERTSRMTGKVMKSSNIG